MRAILIPLLAAEEVALRKVHLGSARVSPDLVLRLKELALIERAGSRGWRLTPLGKRRYRELPSAPLRGRGPSFIDDILNRFIPMAQASGIVKAGEIEAAAAGAFASPAAHHAPRILVAEDSYLEATELAYLLRDCGYEVVGPVGELSEAMMLASGLPLDGALLDIDLGGELSFGVASTLQRRSVPLAFISGHDPSIVPDAQQLRAIPFVAKPFEDEAVVAMVKTFAT